MSGYKKWGEIRREATGGSHEPLRTLAELRRESGLSQQEVAEEPGVSQASVSKIERQDDPQVSTLMRYLGALGANLEVRAIFPDRSARVYFLEDTDIADIARANGRATVGEDLGQIGAHDATRGEGAVPSGTTNLNTTR